MRPDSIVEMRRIAVVGMTAMLLSTTVSPVAGAGGSWRPGSGRAERYIATRAGNVTWAVKSPSGKLYASGGQTKVPAASVFKAMLMTAYLRQGSVRDRPLYRSDKDLLAPMIKRSDNAAATRIADMLGPRRIYRLARNAEMHNFTYTRPWGLSEVTATEQTRFFFHLERYLPKRHEDYARYLLSHVVESQRWGIGRVQKPNWRKYFKGGWGSGTGAVCHQVAFIERRGMRIAVSVMITSSPSHTYAKRTLRGVFKRLLRELPRP
jgi:hypothetical protein